LVKTEEFDYELPRHFIAQRPAARREYSRLLVLHRESGEVHHRQFYQILNYLRPGDLLVLNNTKVIPALLEARRQTGGRVEILLVKESKPEDYEASHPDRPRGEACWEVLAKSRGRLK